MKFTNEQMMKFTSSLKRNLSGYLSPSENENVFSLSDLVSVKVWGRPWWPRQIVDPALFSVLIDVWQRKKSGQTRHTCIKIVQQIGILTRCVILPRSRSLVEMIEHCVSDENWKVRTIITLFFAALAEVAAPYGIEGWDLILGSLWKEIRSNQGKILADKSNLTLELKRKSHFSIHENIDQAVENSHFDLFFNQGQCFSSSERDIVLSAVDNGGIYSPRTRPPPEPPPSSYRFHMQVLGSRLLEGEGYVTAATAVQLNSGKQK